MSEGRSDNLLSIQLLRGIAAFLVLLHHVMGGHLSANNPLKWVTDRGWMGVEIFFIISGFIIPYSMFSKDYKLTDFKVFFIKRISRIEPPYILSIALVLLLNYSNTLSPWYKGPAFTIDWLNVLGHLGYMNAFTLQPWLNVAYWTLAIEFEYYIILALIYPLITHNNKLVIFGSFAVLLAASFISVPGEHILSYLPFFLMGIGMFLFKVNKITIIELTGMVILSLSACYFLHTPVLIFVSIGVLLIIQFIKKVPKALLWLGTISYSLYLTHNVITTRFLGLAGRYFKGANPVILLISDISFCLLAAYLYYLIIERPTINLSKRIQYRHLNKQNEKKTQK